MAENETKQSLASKLAAIGNEIGIIAKSGRNSQQNYDFIEYAVVSGKLRNLFDKYKISIIPQVDDYEVSEVQNKYGNVGYHYTLRMSFLIKDGDSDEEVERKWLSEAIDYGDKSINKAETAGAKYFYMRLFNISEKGEKEADQDTPEVVKQPGAEPAPHPSQTREPGNRNSLSFDEIREAIKDMDASALEAYKAKIMAANMTQKQEAAIKAIFKQREDAIIAHNMGF